MSNIEVICEPRVVKSWRQFKDENPPYSIALDGYVHDKNSVYRDEHGPYASFDHHGTLTDRIITSSTSEQVHIEINLGLINCFSMEGIPTSFVFINDPDEDTCLASWLILNHEIIKNPRINRLVYCEDKLDRTAGSYPIGDTTMHRIMNWIFEPYTNIRFNGSLYRMNGKEMANIVDSVHSRISRYVFGNYKEISIDGKYEILKNTNSFWHIIKETGPYARKSMFNDGINAFASILNENEDGSKTVVIGRKSVWIPFDINKIYVALNKKEKDLCNFVIDKSNMWGGSNTIGGSPRKTGTKMSIDDIISCINSVIK